MPSKTLLIIKFLLVFAIGFSFIFSMAMLTYDDDDSSWDWTYFNHEGHPLDQWFLNIAFVFKQAIARFDVIHHSSVRQSIILDLEMHEKSPPLGSPVR